MPDRAGGAAPLTLDMLFDMANMVEATPHHPPPLILPHWFPTAQRPLAERWAREHGWDGIVYTDRGVPRGR